jgi:membrane-associated phospholipid phosphatase
VVLHAQLGALGAGRRLRAGNLLLCAGILYSTIATRQHVVLDAVGGAVLGAAASVVYLGALPRILRRG